MSHAYFQSACRFSDGDPTALVGFRIAWKVVRVRVVHPRSLLNKCDLGHDIKLVTDEKL
jgi:hypothetical protein